MTAGDLFSAAPGAILLGLLPGLLLATAVDPHLGRAERAAMAPGLSCGAVGLLGLLFHAVRVPFALGTALPAVAVLGIGAAVRRSRARRAGFGPAGGAAAPSGGAGHIWPIAASAVAGLAAAVTAGVRLRDEPLPLWNDPAVHAQVAAAIARHHDILTTVPIPADGSSFVRADPGFEGLTALSAALGRGSVATVMLPLVLLSIAVLPLSLAVLARATTRSARIATLAPLLGVGMAFPVLAVVFGVYESIVDSTLVVALVLAGRRVVRGERPRASAAMIAVLTAAAWVNHPVELPTVLLVGLPLLAAELRSGPWRRRATRAGVVAASAAGGALAAHLLTRLPAVASPSTTAGVLPSAASRALGPVTGVGVLDIPGLLFRTQLSTLAILLVYAGMVVAVLQRRLRWAVTVQLTLGLIVYDVLVGGRLHGLWIRLFPWSVIDRVVGISYWVAPLLMAVGALAVAERLALRFPRRGRLVELSAAGGMALATLAWGVERESDTLAGAVAEHSRVSAADVAVLRALDREPAGLRVLTDADKDAGIWVGALTHAAMILPKPYLDTHGGDWRVDALAGACSDPGRATAALRDVDLVFVGARPAADAAHPWDEGCLARLPGLRLSASASDGHGVAAAFHVASPAAGAG